MSLDMEQAEPHGDVAQFDPESYQLDLDAGVEANDIDIQLETYETEVQYQISHTDPDSGLLNPIDDLELGFDEEPAGADEPRGEQVDFSHHQEANTSADVEPEYGDEIGYDEDEDGGDGGTTEIAPGLDVSAPQTVSDESNLEGEPQETIHEEFVIEESYNDAVLHEDDAGQENGHDIPAPNGGASEVQDTEQSAALAADNEGELVSSNTELEEIDGASGDASELPSVEVQYEGTRYSLFGSQDDDPNSFFLSEPKYLDLPLNEFLISIRHVIEDDLSDHDELSVRIPSLSLEFGEQSKESFLRRHNFREIHDCWTRLFPDSGEEPSHMVLHLVACPDPEHRFAHLLAETGLPSAPVRLEGLGKPSEDHRENSYDDDTKDGASTRAYTETQASNFEDNFEDESASVSKVDSGEERKMEGSDSHEGLDGEDGSLDAATDEERRVQLSEQLELGVADEQLYFDEYHMADVGEDGVDIEDQEFPEANDHMSPGIGELHGDNDIVVDVEVSATGETAVSVVGTGIETASEFYGKSPQFSFQSNLVSHDKWNMGGGGSLWDEIDYSDDEDVQLPPSARVMLHKPVYGGQSPRLHGPETRGCQDSLIDTFDEVFLIHTPISGSKRKLGPDTGFGSRPAKKTKIDAQVGNNPSFTAHYAQTPKRVIGVWHDPVTDIACDEALFSTPTLFFTSDSSPGTRTFLDVDSESEHTDIFMEEEEINVELGEDFSIAPHEPSTGPDSHDETQGQNDEYHDDDSAAPADQRESNHTSATSTIDGDEIDYEENAADEAGFAVDTVNNEDPDVEAGDGDEIDWRNDEDEEESTAPQTAESPSSVSVKRSRTDDADNLIDEADHKRRRT
ncbi:hypothetical protein V8F33_007699 [Rhypophila sp. PSN 637]